MERQSKTCNEVQADIPLFVGRDLTTEELAAMDAHLLGCADCRSELTAAEEARRSLLQLRTAPAPEIDLWVGVSARLAQEGLIRTEDAPVQHRWPLRRVAGVFAGGGLAAAAAVLAVIGFQGWLMDDNDPEDLVTPITVPSVEPDRTGPDRTGPTAPTIAPVGAPVAGGLQRIDPSDALRPTAIFDASQPPVFVPRQPGLNPNQAASSVGPTKSVKPVKNGRW